jgi:hypothetical protein
MSRGFDMVFNGFAIFLTLQKLFAIHGAGENRNAA